MVRQRFATLGLTVLCLAVPSAAVGADRTAAVREAHALAARIDEAMQTRWAADGITPAPLADDAEFMRRVHLDLAGRIPRVAEVRAFLEDRSADKRQRLVEHLLDSSFYVSHFTRVWGSQILPESNNPQLRFRSVNFENWLRQKFRDNVAYDQLVRELLTSPVNFDTPQARQSLTPRANFVLAFYQANEFQPENLAAATSRMFLGVKLECAQCHDHPHARWTRQQFWEFAAFFAGIQPQGPNNRFAAAVERAERRELKIPGTEKVVQARFLDGKEPQWQPGTATRQVLAEWLTSRDNPYFARAAVNRMWAHFFGIGLVDPVDEGGDDNPPSHPQILDELAHQFAAHDFDLPFLVRAIVNSRTYQRQSARTHESQDDPRQFARMAVKGLTPEQLFDSLAQATAYREAPQANQGRVPFNQPGGARAEFLARFASQDRKTEQQTSILQALALMNGRFTADVTDLQRSETLAAVLDAPFLDDAQRIETLYLATLTRKPRPEELDRLMKYVESGGPRKDRGAAIADAFWALLNSSEFILNH